MLEGKLLHVGCSCDPLPFWAKNCEEVRFDIDPKCNPDIVGDMTDLGDIGGFDLVLGIHVLEHVFPHEVKIALKEFHRVLKKGGTALMFVPDLEDARPTKDWLYDVPVGFVCGLDLYYGHSLLVKDNPYMAHKTGFTKELLIQEFEDAGFREIIGTRIKPYNLMVGGKK